MQNVVGIRFKDTGKIYDFDPCGLDLKAGDLVVVDFEKGNAIGKVVKEAYEVDVAHSQRKIIRKASEEDLKRIEENENLKKEISEFCRTRIKEIGLPMRLIFTELSFDGSKAVFYFSSEGRIDFRELVKDLAARFKIRIEMKQIGVRDEARLLGGYGCCGRTLCCETFIKDFEPVSIRMAKKQELALNPAKISGVCGRLMCCLVFEYEIYDEIKKDTTELRGAEKSSLQSDNSTPVSPAELRTKTEGINDVSALKDKTVSLSPITGEKNGKENRQPVISDAKRKRRRRRRRRRKGPFND